MVRIVYPLFIILCDVMCLHNFNLDDILTVLVFPLLIFIEI